MNSYTEDRLIEELENLREIKIELRKLNEILLELVEQKKK